MKYNQYPRLVLLKTLFKKILCKALDAFKKKQKINKTKYNCFDEKFFIVVAVLVLLNALYIFIVSILLFKYIHIYICTISISFNMK